MYSMLPRFWLMNSDADELYTPFGDCIIEAIVMSGKLHAEFHQTKRSIVSRMGVS